MTNKTEFISMAVTPVEKMRWWQLADRMGFKSLSAMVRAALLAWEEEHGAPPSP